MICRLSRWRLRVGCCALAVCNTLAAVTPVSGQTVTHRGFVEARGQFFPQDTSNDSHQVVGDFLWREEAFVKPAPWIQFAGGVDARANSHAQVDAAWRIDTRDRGIERPAISLRRLSATLTRGPLTIDIGKQFIRWGKADIVTPTDRFAPRDFVSVVDAQFLPVTGIRGVAELGANRLEGVFVPVFTPSRIPLLDQRWTAVPDGVFPPGFEPTFRDASPDLPNRGQAGIRWGRTEAGFEYALSFFDGFNTLPNVAVVPSAQTPGRLNVVRTYPALRSYGAEAAVPLPWFTLKGEAGYFTSPDQTADDYVLVVVQVERQRGEWLFLGGYAGEVVTARRTDLEFAPDRGLTRSFVARASKTVDTNRSIAVESAVRQNLNGAYFKGEYSQSRGTHWRGTVGIVVLTGEPDDFLGQYRRNSHLIASLRFSY